MGKVFLISYPAGKKFQQADTNKKISYTLFPAIPLSTRQAALPN
jgi:hypothetical protein